MRERHPIDERFKALHDAEATPPEVVREALGQRLGWRDATPRTGHSRSWLPGTVGLLLISGFIGFLALRDTEDRSGAMLTPGSIAHASDATIQTAGQTPRSSAVVEEPGTTNTTPEASAMASSSLPGNDRGQQHLTTNQGPIATDGATGEETGMTPHIGGSSGEPILTGSDRFEEEADPGSLSGNEASRTPDPKGATLSIAMGGPQELHLSSTATTRGTSDDARAMSARDIQWNIQAIGTPVRASGPVDFYQPKGAWWVGPYAAVGRVVGEWRGDDAQAMRSAEQWRSTTQWGIMGGRNWRNGWGASVGIGLARVRSVFDHEAPGVSSTMRVVDTTWTEVTYNTAGQDFPVNTWSIDSSAQEIPGAPTHATARNHYAAAQLPITLYWHQDVQRFKLGAFCGATLWAPLRSRGLTLVTDQQSGQLTSTSLADARAGSRSGTQVLGHLGASLGYLLHERLGVFAEPMVTRPLVSFGGSEAPVLTRPLLQLRLAYELRPLVH